MALIHKFKQGDNAFVLDVNTGAVHIVDDLVYDLVDDNGLRDKEVIINELKDKYDEKEISEAYDEIKQLVDEDMLYTKDMYEDIAHSSMDDRDYIKAVCLNIIHGCNLRCKYCFAVSISITPLCPWYSPSSAKQYLHLKLHPCIIFRHTAFM